MQIAAFSGTWGNPSALSVGRCCTYGAGFGTDPSGARTLSDTDALIMVAAGMVTLWVDSLIIQVLGLIFTVVVVFAPSFATSAHVNNGSVR